MTTIENEPQIDIRTKEGAEVMLEEVRGIAQNMAKERQFMPLIEVACAVDPKDGNPEGFPGMISLFPEGPLADGVEQLGFFTSARIIALKGDAFASVLLVPAITLDKPQDQPMPSPREVLELREAAKAGRNGAARTLIIAIDHPALGPDLVVERAVFPVGFPEIGEVPTLTWERLHSTPQNPQLERMGFGMPRFLPPADPFKRLLYAANLSHTAAQLERAGVRTEMDLRPAAACTCPNCTAKAVGGASGWTSPKPSGVQ